MKTLVFAIAPSVGCLPSLPPALCQRQELSDHTTALPHLRGWSFIPLDKVLSKEFLAKPTPGLLRFWCAHTCVYTHTQSHSAPTLIPPSYPKKKLSPSLGSSGAGQGTTPSFPIGGWISWAEVVRALTQRTQRSRGAWSGARATKPPGALVLPPKFSCPPTHLSGRSREGLLFKAALCPPGQWGNP